MTNEAGEQTTHSLSGWLLEATIDQVECFIEDHGIGTLTEIVGEDRARGLVRSLALSCFDKPEWELPNVELCRPVLAFGFDEDTKDALRNIVAWNFATPGAYLVDDFSWDDYGRGARIETDDDARPREFFAWFDLPLPR